jgi:predicted transcriptional regulator
MVDEHAMTVRLDDDRFQRLRREAYEREITRTDIIREALDAHFAAYYSQSPEVRYGSR